MIYNDILSLIGNTPLVRYSDNILLKLEFFNPSSSVKARAAFNMINEAIKRNSNIIAPCTHCNECESPEDDWCSSVVRVQRSKVHKILKSGDVPFEDEKFSTVI